MAGGNMGALDFSLGIRDNFSKPLEQLEKKLNDVSSYANKDLLSSIKGSYEKSAEDIKKSINKLQYAWDDVDAAMAKVTEKHPFTDTSSFDKVRDKIKDIATEFMSIVQTTNKFDMDWSKKLTGFFKSADVDFQMHQITALSKAAQNEVNASTKAEEKYWKREQKAIDRATASYANIGKEFMSLSKIKAGLLNQEFASPKDEATTIAAVKSLDQYIEVMKKAKQQYVDLADQGRAQESILGKGGAALGQVFSSEYWTTKNDAVETMRMALTNWKALTQEQKEEKRQALAAIDAIVANAKTAANAQKGIQQEEKKTIQGIDDTKVRYRELQRIFSEGLSVRKKGFLSNEEVNKLNAGLSQLAEKLLNLRSYVNDGTKGAPYLFNTGEAKNQIKDLQDLISLYESNIRTRSRDSERAKRESDRQAEKDRRQTERDNKQAERDYAKATREVGQAAQTELNRQQRIIDMRNREEKALDDTTKRYIQLYDVLKSLQSVRSDRLGLGGDVTKLNSAITDLLPKVRELHDAAYSGRAARTLYNSAASQRDIDLAKQLASDEAKVNKELEKQVELSRQRVATNALANNKTAANASKGIEQEEKRHEQSLVAEQRQIDATIERYAKLFAILREGYEVAGRSNRLGQNTTKLTEGLQQLAEKVSILRGAVGRGGYLFNLFDKGQDKVDIENIRQLIRSYETINKEAEKAREAQKAQVASQRQAAEASVASRAQFLEGQKQMMVQAYSQGNSILNPSELDQVKEAYQAITNELRTLQTVMQNLSSYSIRDLFAMGHQNGDYSTVANNVKDRVAQEERYQQRVNDLIAQRQHASEQAAKADNERIAQEESQFNSLEAKMREVASAYSQLRDARNNTAQLGGNTSEMDAELQHLRELFTQLNSLRWGRGGANGTMAQTFVEADNTIQKVNADVKKARENVTMMETSIRSSAQATRDLASAFDRVHNSASKSSQVLSDIKSLFFQGGIVFSAQQFANSIIQTGGDIVQQHIALRSILGDVQKADELFNQTQQLALQSPFKFQELNRDVKQLAAFGVDTDKLYDTTKRLADVASGLGVSFERLGLAYGQVKSRSWLDGKELRQFAYAGLPMLEKIAELYNDERKNGKSNYTTSDVRDMITKRQVSFEDVDKVFQRLTDEGGQFYNMQFVLSETLLGRWNKLEDAWSIMLGKFADGKSVIGQVFATAINGATEFVLQLDKISPMLLSAGAVFGGKKIFGAAMGAMGLGISSLNKQMALAEQSAVKTFATRQMQDVMEQKITAEMAQQNILKQKELLSSTAVKDLTYLQLAAEGKLSVMQMGELARRGQISATTISQLQAIGTINEQQAYLLNQLRMENIMRKNNLSTMLQLGASSIGSKIGSFLTPGNIAMVGATVGLSLWMGYKQWSDKVNADIETMEKSAKQSAKRYDDFLKNLGGKGDGGLQKQVDSMKEVLETSGDYTDTIKEQVENAKSLSDQYDILKKNIQDAAQVNNMMSGSYGKAVSGAEAATGLNNEWILSKLGIKTPKFLQWVNGLTNDDLEENVKDAENSLQNYQLMFDTLDKNTQASMEKFIQGLASKNKELSNMIQGLPIAEQIRVLAFTGGADWEAFVKKFGNGSDEVDNWLKELSKRAKSSSDDVSEIMYDDVPKGLEYLRNAMGKSQTEFRQWAVKNPQIFAAMMDAMARKANITSKTILYYFHKAISDLFNFNFWPTPPKNNNNGGPKPYRNGLSGLPIQSIRAALRGNGTMVVGKNVGEYDAKLRQVQDETWEKTGQNIQKEYKDARNEYDQINSYYKKQGGKVSKAVKAQMNSLKHQLDEWVNIANAAGVTLDVGKNKTTGNFGKQRKDNSAEKAEREFMRARQKEENSIQAYYDTWDKWRKVEGDANARMRVANDPRFSKEFRSKYTDPEQLAANYEKLARSIAQTTDERKQFVQELKSKAAEKEAQVEYENAQRLNNIFKEQLDNLSKRYDLYQRLEKVAGRDVAGGVAFGSQSHSNSYYAYLLERLNTIQSKNVKDFVENGGVADNIPDVKISANATKVDFSKHGGLEGVLEMPDEDVLSEYGTNVSNLIKALKAERDKLDASIADSLEQGYSYFHEYGYEIDAINLKYDEQIKRLQERNKLDKDDKDYLSDKDLKQQTTVLNQQRQRENAAVGYKRLQDSDTWRNFFGATFLLGSKDAEKYGKVIKDDVTQVFKDGGITADEYSNKIKDINKTMDDVRSNRSDMFTYFFGGGIGSLIDKYNNKGQQMSDKGAAGYEKYQRQYDEAAANGDVEGMEKAKQAMSDANSMMEAGENMMKGASKAASTVAIIDKVVNGINDNVQKLKALMNDIADTIETFSGSDSADNFRNSAGYAFVSGFSNASQGATDAWNSLKSGNVMGVVEGGFRSIIGWATPWAQRHDAKLQKQIETAERTNKLIDSMRNSIERRLSNSLGGVYGYKGNSRDIKKIQDGLDNYSLAKTGAKYGRNTVAHSSGMGAGLGALGGVAAVGGTAAVVGATTGLGAGATAGLALGSAAGPIGAAIGAAVGAIFGGLFGHKRKKYKTNYTEDTYDSMVKANQTQAYYDQMLASYKMQRDNLDAQLNAEEKKKKKDKDKISDYQSQLDELDDKIKTFAKDMAKSLYDIDVKSWAKELTDAVVSAWAAGEDAVDAYRDKVKDLMKTLATNIVTQKIMERAMQPVEDYIEKTMDAKSGKLDENDIVAIANMLDTIGNDTIPSITDFFEKLKDKGWDLSDTNSASMSSSIKGITENTADLLSSYINAIRADVSVIRLTEGLYLPKLDITATAQLQQLTMITENTRRNADAAEEIRSSVIEVTSILTASRNGTRALTVKVE